MTSNELEIFKQSILDDVRVLMQTTGQVTQYIGARYVPLFAEPFEWDNKKEYEPLTIVTNKGNTYTSRQFVPKGISIDDTKFWALTANFNAQIEEYRKEVKAFDARITANTNNIATKAPISHADSTGQYGLGSSSDFGHLKVVDSGSSPATESVAASPKMVSDLDAKISESYYSKTEADEKFAVKPVDGEGAILGCIGDSILAGWSNEHPKNIPAWDVYLAKALGFESSNVYKEAIGGAGFVSGTTFATEISTLKTTITSAGRKAEDVKVIVIGGGINDSIIEHTSQAVLAGASNAVNAACAAFPNATIHIFPMIMGWKGLRTHLLMLEDAIVEGALLCQEEYRKRVVTHTGCWSWCYDGIDDGVSADGIHLLQKGEQRVGSSMAVEINGGSAYRSGYSFDISNAQGQKVATGHRRDSMVFFKIATNLTSIKISSDNVTLGMHPRYCSEHACITFTQPDETKNIIMFADVAKGFFNAYTALNNTGCYGDVAYQIDFRANIS